jgi:hypothetical protein
MNTKIIAVIFFAVTAGMFALTRTNVRPSDLRDAVADRDFDTSIPVIDKNNGDIPEVKAVVTAPADQNFMYVREYTYTASETDNKASARTAALAEIKRQLLEELGTYVRSETVVKDNALVTDKIVSMTGGLIETKILAEKWTGETFYLKARMKVDPETLKKIKEAAEKSAPQPDPADSGPRKYVGKRVLHSYYGVGDVKEVFQNGSAIVNFYTYPDPTTKTIKVRDLALKVECYEKVCENYRVLHSYYGIGKVEEVFDNGNAIVLFINARKTVKARDLAPSL